MVLADAPRSVDDRLQRMLNAVARLVSGTYKYNRGQSQLLRVDLCWLDVADWVRYKLAITVHRCLHNRVPKYLADCCMCHCLWHCWSSVTAFSTPSPAGRTAISTQHTRPSDVLCRCTNHLEVSSRRALTGDWGHFPAVVFFAHYQCAQRVRGYTTIALYKATFYLLTTYLPLPVVQCYMRNKIISAFTEVCRKLFQNYFRGLLQLMNISNTFNIAEIILAAEIILFQFQTWLHVK